MKRLFLAIALLMWAGVSEGATYYVNSATGSDGMNGLSTDNAWKNVEYAVKMLTTNDTLIIVAPATSPGRGLLNANAAGPVTVQGTSATNRAHVIAGKDISHGATVENLIKNGEMEAWESATALWKIAPGSSAHSPETTIVKEGIKSLKAVRSGSTLYYPFDVLYLPGNTEFTLSYWHQENAAYIRPKYEIKESNPTPDKYLQVDNVWCNNTDCTEAGVPSSCCTGAGAGTCTGYMFDPNDNHENTWGRHSKTFTTNAAGTYRITIALTNNATYYIDNLSLIPSVATYAWEVHSDNTYKLTGWTGTVKSLAKSSSADWSASGAAALGYAPKADNVDDCVATAGSWWWEGGITYYHLADGETIETVHIEVADTSDSYGFVMDQNTWTVANANFYLANNANVYLNGKDLILNNVGAYLSNLGSFLTNSGATATLNDCHAKWAYSEDGFGGPGTLTCNRCKAEYMFDDGFMPTTTGSLTCNYCLSLNNGLEEGGDNSGFATENASSTLKIYNSVAYGNYGRGISAGKATEMEIKNTIAYGTTNGVDLHDPGTDPTIFTHTNNIFGDKSEGYTLHATESIADPLFRDPANGDFRLKAGSPAINAGIAINGLTTDFLGNPIRGLPDIGSYEYQGGSNRFPDFLNFPSFPSW